MLLKLASEAPSGPVICSLVHVLLRCTGASSISIPIEEGGGQGQEGMTDVVLGVSDQPLSTTSTKPASRLLLRVLAEESRRPEPFVFADTTDKGQVVGQGVRVGSQQQQLRVLSTMHRFLSAMHQHQQQQLQASGTSPGGDVMSTVLADDTPTTTVRAVLTEMAKALGGAVVMGRLVQLQLPRSAPIFRLVSRVTGLPVPPNEDTNKNNNQSTTASTLGQGLSDSDGERERAMRQEEEEEAVLRVSLSALIDEITSARYTLPLL